MATRPKPENLWDIIRELERRLKDLETGSRIGQTSIPDGRALTVLDAQQNPVTRMGTRLDGTYGLEQLVSGAWKPILPAVPPPAPPPNHKILAGIVNIAPTAANTPTSVPVSFPAGFFSSTPVVQVTPYTTVPGTTVTGASAASVSATGFVLWATRTNTTTFDCGWVAILPV